MQDWKSKEDLSPKWESVDDSAVAAVMKKAAAGKPITVAALGGSITEGFHSSCPEKSYAGIMRQWWEDKFPDTDITYINGGIGATDSYLGLHRARRDILRFQPDFVIVDFTVNDPAEEFYEKSYERLIRTLLGAESSPAVVLIFMTKEDGTNAREYHARVGAKYRLPMINYGSVVLEAIQKGDYKWADISPDDIHPNDRGHAIAGGMVGDYLNHVYDTFVKNGAEKTAEPETPDGQSMRARISEGTILDAAGLIPTSAKGWEKADLHPHLHDGWLGSSQAGSLEFELEFAGLGITYFKSVDGTFGQADVYVDGEFQKTLDGDYSGGWGDYGQSDEVYSSETRKKHHVEIKVMRGTEEVKFGVLALLVS